MSLVRPPTFAVLALRPQPSVPSFEISAQLILPIVSMRFRNHCWGARAGIIQKDPPAFCDVNLQLLLPNNIQGLYPNPDPFEHMCKQTDIHQTSNSFVKISICDYKVSTWRSWRNVCIAAPSYIDILTATPVAYCEQASKQESHDENEARRGKGDLEHEGPILFRSYYKLERLFGGSRQCNLNPGRGSASRDLYHLGLFFAAVVQQPDLLNVLPVYLWPTAVDVEDYIDVAMHMAVLTYLFDWILTRQFLPFAPPGFLGSAMAWKVSLMGASVCDVAFKNVTGVEIHCSICRAFVAMLVSCITTLRINFVSGSM